MYNVFLSIFNICIISFKKILCNVYKIIHIRMAYNKLTILNDIVKYKITNIYILLSKLGFSVIFIKY